MTIEVVKAKRVNKGCLSGSLDILIPTWGLQINGITIWSKGGQRWVNMPSWKFEDGDGKECFAPYVKITCPERYKKFKGLIMEHWDKWCQQNPEHPSALAEPSGAAPAAAYSEASYTEDNLPF